jgi:hypothetical protein
VQEHDDACTRLLQQLQSDAHKWLDEIEAGLQDAACLLLHFSGKTRQHTSAYVSIRQHTSAYVSIRQQGLREAACLPLDFSGKDLEIQALKTSLNSLTS